MFRVIEQFNKKEMGRFRSQAEAERWCGRVAYEENYGRFRTWQKDGVIYMDCGPRTFILERLED